MPPYDQGSNLTESYNYVINNFEEISAEFYATLYAERHWSKVIAPGSIETNISPGATTTSYLVTDRRGVGGFLSNFGGDVPTVGGSVKKIPVSMHVAGIGAIVSREDLRNYQHSYGPGLDTEFMTNMREGCEDHVEGVFFFGQPELGIEPFLDNSGVAVVTAVNPGSGTEWVNKTPDEILFDINDAITDVWADSNEIHVPGMMRIPSAQFGDIAGRRIAQGNDLTVLEYIKRNNVYTAKTGRELDINSLPYLKGAGVAGVDRMMVYTLDPRIHKMPFPIPFTTLQPQLEGMKIKFFAEYKFGGCHWRWPGSAVYVDGI